MRFYLWKIHIIRWKDDRTISFTLWFDFRPLSTNKHLLFPPTAQQCGSKTSQVLPCVSLLAQPGSFSVDGAVTRGNAERLPLRTTHRSRCNTRVPDHPHRPRHVGTGLPILLSPMQVGRVQRKLNKRWCAAHFVSGSGQQRRRGRSDINPFYLFRPVLTGFIHLSPLCPLSDTCAERCRDSFSRCFWTLFTGTCVTGAGDVACSPGRTRALGIKGGLRSRHLHDTGVEVGSCGSFSGRRASPLRAPKTASIWFSSEGYNYQKSS